MHTKVLTTLVLLGCSAATQAATLDEQRALFSQTLDAVSRNDTSTVERNLKILDNYPLKPYIEYELLRKRLGSASLAQINAFSKAYPDTPLEGRLRWAMTNELASRKDWSGFLSFYNTLNSPNVTQQCYEGLALLNTGKTKAAYEQAEELWSVGHSQPSACDPLFSSWMSAGKLNDSVVLKRAIHAISEGNTSLTTYIEKLAKGKATKATIDLAQSLYNDPEKLLNNPALVTTKTAYHRVILTMATHRLARKDYDKAITLWLRDRSRLKIPADRQDSLNERLALAKAVRFTPDAREKMAALDPNHHNTKVTEWQIRLALLDADWKAVSQLVTKLPKDEQTSERWSYWSAVAASHQQLPYRDQLETLSHTRSFYGFLASELLNKPFSLNHAGAEFTDKEAEAIAKRPAFQRISELYKLGRDYDARSEWNTATAKMSRHEQYISSHIVQDWGWYQQAIIGAARSKYWNDIELRFPNPYQNYFTVSAPKNGISPYWAAAITRQESALLPTARSRVGARGLMQLMPATARHTAKAHDISLQNLDALYEPATNISLGTAYLGDMFSRFDNNMIYATAAYNAGPHRVNRWLAARGNQPIDIWIETIPYNETRNYVQNVVAYMAIYEQTDSGKKALTIDPVAPRQLAFNKPILATSN